MREAQVGRFSRSCVLTHRCAAARSLITGTVLTLTVLAEDVGVIIMTSATNGTLSFYEEEIWSDLGR